VSDIISQNTGAVPPPFDIDHNGNIIHRLSHLALDQFRSDVDVILNQFDAQAIQGINITPTFLETIKFNARCSTNKGRDIVAVNIGSVVFLYEIIGRLMSIDKFFCMGTNFSIGERYVHLWPDLLYETDIRTYDEFEVNIPQAEFCLNFMVSQGIRFSFHHELAHIWNGHCGLTSDLKDKQSSIIKEFGQSASFMLELDADRRAVHWLKAITTMPFTYPDGTNFQRVDKKYEMFLTVSSVYICLRANHYLNGGVERDNNSSHPYPEDRLSWAMEDFFKDLIYKSNYSYTIAAKVIREAVTRSEKCFSIIFSCEYLDIFSDRFMHKNAKERGALHSKWTDLRARLEPYKRGLNLPDMRVIGLENGSDPINLLSFVRSSTNETDSIEFFAIGRLEWGENILRGVDLVFLCDPTAPKMADLGHDIDICEQFLEEICCLRIEIDNSLSVDQVISFYDLFVKKCGFLFSRIINVMEKLDLEYEISKICTLVTNDAILAVVLYTYSNSGRKLLSEVRFSRNGSCPPCMMVCIGRTGDESIDSILPRTMTHPNSANNCASVSGMSYLAEVFLKRTLERIHAVIGTA